MSVFTNKKYNHASLSLDYELDTILSYNGGGNLYPPGLNPEMIKDFSQGSDSSIMVYSLCCSLEQKMSIINKIKEINDSGSAYNMVGLVTKSSFKPNIMFCSQFVYQILRCVGLEYFDKNDGLVQPMDLVEMDYYRKLKFEYELKL